MTVQAYRAQHHWTDAEDAVTMGASWPGASPSGEHVVHDGQHHVHDPERWVPVRFVGDEV